MTTIVITGGNRGIGLDLARLYAGLAGAHLILGVRRPEGVDAPGEVQPLDVGDDKSVAAFASALNGRRVDILINNAGAIGPDRQSALSTDFSGFLDVLNINTLGPLRVTQALLPNLRKAENAKMVVISSRMGSLSYAKSDRVAYRASKAAVNKLVQCLATDLTPENIAVAALHPGWVRTDMGGPTADISVEDSTRGLKTVIDGLSMAQSGQFLSYDGTKLAW